MLVLGSRAGRGLHDLPPVLPLFRGPAFSLTATPGHTQPPSLRRPRAAAWRMRWTQLPHCGRGCCPRCGIQDPTLPASPRPLPTPSPTTLGSGHTGLPLHPRPCPAPSGPWDLSCSLKCLPKCSRGWADPLIRQVSNVTSSQRQPHPSSPSASPHPVSLLHLHLPISEIVSGFICFPMWCPSTHLVRQLREGRAPGAEPGTQ